MNQLCCSDKLCGLLLIAGLAALIAYGWLPGLALFTLGSAHVVVNAARWTS